MILTNTSGEKLPPNAATVEHLISKLHPGRWVKKKHGELRKVLACNECNQEKSKQEIICMSRGEILRRNKGFSLSPKGRPKIVKTLPTVKEVLNKLGLTK